MTTEMTTQQTDIVEANNNASEKLKKYMDDKPNKVFFGSPGKLKRYPEVDDSIYAGSFFGYKASSKDTTPVTVGEQVGFKATAIVVDSTGVQVGSADAYCLNGEPNWSRKPMFQLAGMAQTRAINRALLNLLKPVFRLAGVEATPAEEMIEDRPPVTMPKSLPVKELTPRIAGVVNAAKVYPQESIKKPGVISEGQRKLLFAKCKGAGIDQEDFKAYLLNAHKLEHTADMPWTKMDEVLKWIDNKIDPEIPFGSAD